MTSPIANKADDELLRLYVELAAENPTPQDDGSDIDESVRIRTTLARLDKLGQFLREHDAPPSKEGLRSGETEIFDVC